MMAGIYGFGGGYSESARRKAAGLNDDGSFMPGYSATQGGIADPRGNLVNSRDPFTAGYKQQPLSALLRGAVSPLTAPGNWQTGGALPAVSPLPMPDYSAVNPRQALGYPQTGGAQPAITNAKPMPLPRQVSLDEWLKTGGAQGPRVQAGQGMASPQSSFAMTLADLLRNYYA